MALSETQASHRPGGGVGFPHWLRASLHYPDSLLSHAVLTTPVDRSGADRLYYWRAPAPGSSQTALAFPERTAGRHPHLSFRGLLKLHARYSLRSCSPTYSGLLSRGSDPASYPAEPLVSYQGIPTTPCVGPSPTGNLRHRGARSFCIFQVQSRPRFLELHERSQSCGVGGATADSMVSIPRRCKGWRWWFCVSD
jgi:hypothetical protein